ncbi:MAG: RNA pseudouridine synthase [Deltaproteobacteria bacterium]|nr:RNA pseudouridine synthase [Deltaproteobacteria bacterium]
MIGAETWVLAETPEWLALDKPPGVTTIADRQGVAGVVERVAKARGERLWVVHRLDREVGGLLLVARTAAAHRSLNQAFEHRLARKTYEAYTAGEAPPGEHRWHDRLVHGKKRSFSAAHGLEAITEATCRGPDARGLAWSLRPLTGRTHQLRVHLANAGFPIHGDTRYGSSAPWAPGIALRAVALEIPAAEGLAAIALVAPGLLERSPPAGGASS